MNARDDNPDVDDFDEPVLYDPPETDRDEGFDYGWRAAMRGQFAALSWDQAESALKRAWNEAHGGQGGSVVPDWSLVSASARAGWSAARASLMADL
jgi:hypothetical protein